MEPQQGHDGLEIDVIVTTSQLPGSMNEERCKRSFLGHSLPYFSCSTSDVDTAASQYD